MIGRQVIDRRWIMLHQIMDYPLHGYDPERMILLIDHRQMAMLALLHFPDGGPNRSSWA